LSIGTPLDGTPKRRIKRQELRFRVSDLLSIGPKPRITFVDEEATLDTITDLIISNYFEFVIVRSKNQGPPIGLVHLNDIAMLCCKRFLECKQSFEFTFRMKNSLSQMTANDVIRQKQWLTINMIAPLADVLKLLSLPNSRDVAILGEDQSEIISVITRVDVLSFLFKKKNELTEVMHKKVKECKVNPTVKPLDSMEFAIEYFRILWDKQKSGLWASHGNTTIEKFLTMISVCMQACSEAITGPLSPCCPHSVHVYEEDTLLKVLESINHRSVQRVFVYDDIKQSPRGDLSMADFLFEFQSYV
jgi:predicted transcriptional regulator